MLINIMINNSSKQRTLQICVNLMQKKSPSRYLYRLLRDIILYISLLSSTSLCPCFSIFCFLIYSPCINFDKLHSSLVFSQTIAKSAPSLIIAPSCSHSSMSRKSFRVYDYIRCQQAIKQCQIKQIHQRTQRHTQTANHSRQDLNVCHQVCIE